MDAVEQLTLHVMNDKPLHDSVVFAVKHLRSAMDRAAEAAAKARAEWHDDTEAEDHADYHAPADVQFPPAVRDEAALDLFKHYLGELALQAK